MKVVQYRILDNDESMTVPYVRHITCSELSYSMDSKSFYSDINTLNPTSLSCQTTSDVTSHHPTIPQTPGDVTLWSVTSLGDATTVTPEWASCRTWPRPISIEIAGDI